MFLRHAVIRRKICTIQNKIKWFRVRIKGTGNLIKIFKY